MEENRPSSVLLTFALLCAVTTCSSAGVVFDSLIAEGVPPYLAASWRLWCQTLVLFVPFLVTLKRMKDKDDAKFKLWLCSFENDHDLMFHECENNMKRSNEDSRYNDFGAGVERHKDLSLRDQSMSGNNADITNNDISLWSGLISKYKEATPLLVCSGFFLGIHFSAWVYSIGKTSLTHSLLWVSMGPIVINWSNWSAFLCCSSIIVVNRPSIEETFGAAIGLIGAIIMLGDVQSTTQDSDWINQTFSPDETNKHLGLPSIEHKPTFEGDIAAFLGAVAVSVYLVIGQICRKWMPLFMYAFPVCGVSAFTAMLGAILLDSSQPSTIYGFGANSILGFLNRKYLPYVLYLGAGPGVCGHTVLNALLKYLSPLTVSTAMLMEPLTGSILGYMFGMQSLPGIYTIVGGFILIFGLFLTIIGENRNLSGDQRDSIFSKARESEQHDENEVKPLTANRRNK